LSRSAKLYSMTESAILSLRERKTLATATSITSVARRLTVSNGLSGFTIEEVCDEVGISRRTFFNYFPSKEDAIIGADSEEEGRRILDAFMAQGARGWTEVVGDLVTLIASHFDAVGANPKEHAEFIATLEAEPRLLARFIGVSRERERALVTLVAEREHAAADDPRALAAVSILSTIVRNASESFIAPENTEEIPALLTNTLAAFRTVLGAPQTAKG
jgi:AcrR family transcriptional regulator